MQSTSTCLKTDVALEVQGITNLKDKNFICHMNKYTEMPFVKFSVKLSLSTLRFRSNRGFWVTDQIKKKAQIINLSTVGGVVMYGDVFF